MSEVPLSDLVALQRSVAMQAPGCDVRIPREVAYAVLSELLELRSLIGRFGGDLREVAARSRQVSTVGTRSPGGDRRR